jgi:hypothetical protein
MYLWHGSPSSFGIYLLLCCRLSSFEASYGVAYDSVYTTVSPVFFKLILIRYSPLRVSVVLLDRLLVQSTLSVRCQNLTVYAYHIQFMKVS